MQMPYWHASFLSVNHKVTQEHTYWYVSPGRRVILTPGNQIDVTRLKYVFPNSLLAAIVWALNMFTTCTFTRTLSFTRTVSPVFAHV